MSPDPKTVAIDPSELLAKFGDTDESSAALPQTIPIDSQAIARRQAASNEQQQRGHHDTPHPAAAPATSGPPLGWIIAAVGVVALVVFLALR